MLAIWVFLLRDLRNDKWPRHAGAACKGARSAAPELCEDALLAREPARSRPLTRRGGMR